MNEYEKYLNDVFNDAYKEILPLVKQINDIGKCPCCGGTFQGDVCKYCRTVNENLTVLIERLKRKLDSLIIRISNLPYINVNINFLGNLLYSIGDVELDFVDDFLKKFNYEEVINKQFYSIMERLWNKEEISFEEANLCEAIIRRYGNNKLRDDGKINLLINVSCRQAILKSFDKNRKLTISYEAFKELIRIFMEEQIKYYYENPICKILEGKDDDEKSKVNGTANRNVINIYDYEIKSLYYEGSDALFNVIYHELRHTYQYSVVFKSLNPTLFELLEIKDNILGRYIPGYYNENYDKISSENDARYCALSSSLTVINSLGFTCNMDIMNKKLESIKEGFMKNERTINGILIDMDKEFEEVLKNRPKLLEDYPGLKKYYTIQSGFVIPKVEEVLTEGRST